MHACFYNFFDGIIVLFEFCTNKHINKCLATYFGGLKTIKFCEPNMGKKELDYVKKCFGTNWFFFNRHFMTHKEKFENEKDVSVYREIVGGKI